MSTTEYTVDIPRSCFRAVNLKKFIPAFVYVLHSRAQFLLQRLYYEQSVSKHSCCHAVHESSLRTRTPLISIIFIVVQLTSDYQTCVLFYFNFVAKHILRGAYCKSLLQSTVLSKPWMQLYPVSFNVHTLKISCIVHKRKDARKIYTFYTNVEIWHKKRASQSVTTRETANQFKSLSQLCITYYQKFIIPYRICKYKYVFRHNHCWTSSFENVNIQCTK